MSTTKSTGYTTPPHPFAVESLKGVTRYENGVLTIAWLNQRIGVRVSHKDIPNLRAALASAKATPDADPVGCDTDDE